MSVAKCESALILRLLVGTNFAWTLCMEVARGSVSASEMIW